MAGNIAAVPNIMAINPAVKAGNMMDFIALARSEPDKLSYASPGLGSPIALASLGRSVSPPARVTVVWDGARSAAEARELPLVR